MITPRGTRYFCPNSTAQDRTWDMRCARGNVASSASRLWAEKDID
ncbi:MAG TPA: hypothetical protein VK157_15300 [Phycisphaerales bacterium]|nr:hypothetical protein [Phycisphaerales bacterium]